MLNERQKMKEFLQGQIPNNSNVTSEKGTKEKEMRSRKIPLRRNKHYIHDRVDGLLDQ